MRLQFGLGQIAADLADRNGRHDPAVDDFVGQFAMRPAIDGPSRLFGRLAGHGQDLRHLLGGECAGRTTTRGVAENVFDGAAKFGLRFATFDGHQGVERLLPTPPPEADLLSRQADFLGDVHIERSGECQ